MELETFRVCLVVLSITYFLSALTSSAVILAAFCHDRRVAVSLQDKLYKNFFVWLYYHLAFPLMLWEIRQAFKHNDNAPN